MFTWEGAKCCRAIVRDGRGWRSLQRDGGQSYAAASPKLVCRPAAGFPVTVFKLTIGKTLC
jgi:hypothetical protein